MMVANVAARVCRMYRWVIMDVVLSRYVRVLCVLEFCRNHCTCFLRGILLLFADYVLKSFFVNL